MSSSDDCDDADPIVFPGATELCDGVDQDCDGSIDEDLRAHADGDGDGFGDAVAMVPCADGVGDGTDCDDAVEAVHPGAAELCNTIDDDCDGDVDEDPVDEPSWFVDADADGWGTGSAVSTQCEPISGHASAAGDCDDADPAISPGAEEICDNGVDEDCDGGGCRIEGDWDAEEHAAFTIMGDTDYEGIDDVGSLWVGATPGLFVASRSHAWLFRTPPNGAQYVSTADATLSFGATATQVESVLLGDIDGDGDSDPAFTIGSSATGSAVYVLSADVASGNIADQAWLAITGSWGLGASRHAGDADGDGLPDLAFETKNRALVSPIAASGSAEALATTVITSGDASISFACDVDLGDLDGDGVADLAVGAALAGEGGVWADGAVYVYHGPFGAARTDADADLVLADPSARYWFGTYLQVENDLDGDGTDDLLVASLVGEYWTLFSAGETSGRAYFGGGGSKNTIDTGDLDADGQADLVFGKWDGEGQVYYGPVSDGDHGSSSDADSVILSEDFAAPGLRFIGDLDGDGFDDIGVISPAADTPVARQAGKVWGLLGSDGF